MMNVFIPPIDSQGRVPTYSYPRAPVAAKTIQRYWRGYLVRIFIRESDKWSLPGYNCTMALLRQGGLREQVREAMRHDRREPARLGADCLCFLMTLCEKLAPIFIRRRACPTIQRYWRGYRVRGTRRMVSIREAMLALK